MGNKQETLPDIRRTAVFNAPIQKVWEAVSTSDAIATWFMPNDFQPEVGSEFHLQSPFGPSLCKVLTFDPPNELSFSWDNFGWVATFELKALGAETEFTLTHSGWKESDETIQKAQERQSVIRDRMNSGWDKLVNESLRKFVESK